MAYLNPHTAVVDPLLVVLADTDFDQDDDLCWEWTGNRDRDGYGVKTYKGRQWRAHRLAFMLATGEDPGELHVRHRCDNPPCFRPSHLLAGTNQDNVDDKVSRGRSRNQYMDADACVYGHKFDAANTYVNPASGNRQCRACRRANNALDRRLVKFPAATKKVLREVFRERARQDFVFDEQNHPDGTGQWVHEQTSADLARESCQKAAAAGEVTWRHILREEYYEALAESVPGRLRAELIQVAAVAVAWVEAIDRRERATALEQARPHSVAADLGEAVDSD